jgi:hypothetical protein
LHQHQRPTDGDDNIVAVPQDYAVAKILFEHSYYAGPASKVGELLAATRQVGVEEFLVADLVRTTGWGKSKTYAVLSRAEDLGCIAEGEKHGRYCLVRANMEPPLDLPAKLRLSAANFRVSIGTAREDFQDSTFPSDETEGLPDGKTENCITGVGAGGART